MRARSIALVGTAPSDGASVSGTNVVLDAVTSPDVTSVAFGFVASGCPQNDHVDICMIGSATPTEYGWIGEWNSTQVPNGNTEIVAVAANAVGYDAVAISEVAVTNPTPTIVVPKNDSTVSGSQILGCTSPVSANEVYFLLSGGSLSRSAVLGYATPTECGWLYEWNSTDVANGAYSLTCGVEYPDGDGAGLSPSISVTVSN